MDSHGDGFLRAREKLERSGATAQEANSVVKNSVDVE